MHLWNTFEGSILEESKRNVIYIYMYKYLNAYCENKSRKHKIMYTLFDRE